MPHIESSYNDVIYAVPPMSRPNGNIMTLKNQKKLLKKKLNNSIRHKD